MWGELEVLVEMVLMQTVLGMVLGAAEGLMEAMVVEEVELGMAVLE